MQWGTICFTFLLATPYQCRVSDYPLEFCFTMISFTQRIILFRHTSSGVWGGVNWIGWWVDVIILHVVGRELWRHCADEFCNGKDRRIFGWGLDGINDGGSWWLLEEDWCTVLIKVSMLAVWCSSKSCLVIKNERFIEDEVIYVTKLLFQVSKQ